jgi:hypothetical protein
VERSAWNPAPIGGVPTLMRLLVVSAAAIALLGATATPSLDATGIQPVAARESLSPVLGISYRSPRGALAWFDPLTLKALPGRNAPLDGHWGSWAFSADRGVLAIGNCADTESREIRFVNARTMRFLADLRLSLSAECVSSLTWLRPRRLLAVIQAADDASVVLVDPVARRVLRREPLPDGGSVATGRTHDELVLLLAASAEIGRARVVVADDRGRLRVATVDRVLAGTVAENEGSDYRARTVSPGLAIDPDGRRAFVVPAAGPVAEVDLASLDVSYHQLDRPSVLERFFRWLTPAAQAKLIEGPVRHARWLDGGMIAVSGTDYSVTTNEQGEQRMSAAPAGLRLIDTDDWKTRVLSREASGFAVAPGLVIAQGGRWDSGQERGYGPGLRAFGLDGRERWRLRSGEYRWMDTAGSVGYVYIGEWGAEVVDLATGSILATVRWDVRDPRIQLPQLLSEQTSSW